MKTEELKKIQGRIEAEISKIQAELSEKNQQLTTVKIEISVLEHGFDVGDAVEFMDGKVKKTGVVKSWVSSYGRIEPVVALHKKDGTVGERTQKYFFGNFPKTL